MKIHELERTRERERSEFQSTLDELEKGRPKSPKAAQRIAALTWR
jgi:hypothetical protein